MQRSDPAFGQAWVSDPDCHAHEEVVALVSYTLPSHNSGIHARLTSTSPWPSAKQSSNDAPHLHIAEMDMEAGFEDSEKPRFVQDGRAGEAYKVLWKVDERHHIFPLQVSTTRNQRMVDILNLFPQHLICPGAIDWAYC
jgi:hypothetical protein